MHISHFYALISFSHPNSSLWSSVLSFPVLHIDLNIVQCESLKVAFFDGNWLRFISWLCQRLIWSFTFMLISYFFINVELMFCTVLDDIGHGIRSSSSSTPRSRRSTSSVGMPPPPAHQQPPTSAGPAPTTKPPTPPQANRSVSSLSRGSREYRTPPAVAPPQVCYLVWRCSDFITFIVVIHLHCIYWVIPPSVCICLNWVYCNTWNVFQIGFGNQKKKRNCHSN